MKKIEISTVNAPAAIGPYSQAIEANGMIFASGQIPVDPATGTIPDGVEAQAHQVFRNITALLEAAGSSMENVVRTLVFLKDMNDFAAVNEIYAQYFTRPYPARSCVQVAKIPKDVRIEVEVTALKA